MRQIDLIIFGGQSNMQGQTEALSNTDVVEHAYEYKWLEEKKVPLQNPVGENIPYDRNAENTGLEALSQMGLKEILDTFVLLASHEGNTNLVPEFCRAYLTQSKTDTEVLAVPVAKGSTQIHEWLPGTEGYKAIFEKTKAAIACVEKEYEIQHVFFVWLQGESDAIAGVSKETYKERLLQLNNALKSDFGIDKFSIIRVGCFTNDEKDWQIIDAQSEICRENSDFLMLTDIATKLNKIPEYMNPYVAGHYSAKGLEKLGAEAGKTMGNYKCKITI